MSKNRFNHLLEKYKLNKLRRSEYQELLSLLRDPKSIEDLDQLLTCYWDESESGNFNSARSQITSKFLFKRKYGWAIAASLLLMVGFFVYAGISATKMGNEEMVYSTGYGERLEIELDDGSLITLNANSEIRWTENWEKQKNREVSLVGEAFFEVKKHDGIPFTVHTNDVAVEVLGTSFNVDSRKDKTDVYLEEGKVNLKLLGDKDMKESGPGNEITMKPGDQVKYNARERKMEKTENQNIITAASWKNNVLNFKNMRFSEVLDLLRDIYGQSFECADGKLLNTPMYIGVPYSDWDAVRQALELSLNVEFMIIESRRYSVRSKK